MTSIKYALALLAAALLATGCGGRGASLGTTPLPGPNTEAERAALDTDRDGIGDDLEEQLGTNPRRIDTDDDGLSDHYELWGVSGAAVGTVGDLASLPDPNGNGVIAALDPADMGGQVLKNASALLSQQRVAVEKVEGSALPNDVDGDGIPNDFELNGYYFEVDETGKPWFVRWDGLDISKKYYKTDPAQWSSDGDPFSDWEEATKINLDQRVKSPGDHPCIPAYPEIICVLTGYRIDMIEGVEVVAETGGRSERSWENATETVANGRTVYSASGNEGDFKIGAGLKREEDWIGDLGFAALIQSEVSAYKTSVETSSTVNSSVAVNDQSGLTAAEWANAATTSTNTASAARLTLNMKVVNVGTLPASNPIILCNLVMGSVAINSLVVNMTEYGELLPRAGNPLDIVVQYDGRIIDGKPLGDPLELSLYQLRSLQSGVPLEIEVKGWEGDTLVWEIDPNTGRRSYLTTGTWSPYQSAIQNVTARMVLDLRKDPAFTPATLSGLPPLTVCDTRVFCYNPNGTYHGSPPDIRFGDAFIWAFEGMESDIGPVVTIRDPISKSRHTSPLALWEFSFDRLTIDRILSNPARYGNVFNLPLEPGNPSERIYTCSAPPPEALQNPKIYWATCDPATRRIRAISRDVRGVKEMRFKPDPSADYNGELMQIGFDPEDPHQQFFYTYELPQGYRWTGNEAVVAINRAEKQTILPVQIEGGQLGWMLASGESGVGTATSPAMFSQGYSLGGGALSTLPLHDFTFSQTEYLNGDLDITFKPEGGLVADALAVIDSVDPQGNPVYTIDYNFLRKQDYSSSQIDLFVSATLTDTPPTAHSYCVRSPNGVVSIVRPVYVTDDTGPVWGWRVGALHWRTYDGM